MNLYILRHASAGTRRVNPLIDVKRPLDKEGKQQCILVGNYLNALHVQFDLVVSSPLKRALQTASLVGTETGYDGKIQVSEGLSPKATVKDFDALAASLSQYENVLVVGHNPNLQEFLGRVISESGCEAVSNNGQKEKRQNQKSGGFHNLPHIEPARCTSETEYCGARKTIRILSPVKTAVNRGFGVVHTQRLRGRRLLRHNCVTPPSRRIDEKAAVALPPLGHCACVCA